MVAAGSRWGSSGLAGDGRGVTATAYVVVVVVLFALLLFVAFW